MRKASSFSLSIITIALLFALGCLPLTTFAANSNGTSSNNTPGFIKKAVDQGPVDPSTLITVTVWLELRNQNQLDALVQQQKQPGSLSYHKWLNQSEFNAQFAPPDQEVHATTNFLQAHNLTVIDVAENNFYVKAQGTVSDIEKAFHVQIDSYNLNGITYRSNNSNPNANINGAHVAAITGLDDYGFQPMIARAREPDGATARPVPLSSIPHGFFFAANCFNGAESHTFSSNGVTATYAGNRFGVAIDSSFPNLPPCGYQPSELQTAYNMNPLYHAGLDGAGETVVITDAYGSATIAQDADLFSQIYGLPRITADNFQLIKAPGLVNNPHDGTWADETSLDVEWVHAMAPGARIVLVTATNRGALDEAVNLAVVRHLGNTISNSWGSVEGLGNPAQFDRVNRILEMAAAQGIDVNFSSGDDGDFTTVLGFATVSFPASSPYATGIGGTSLGLKSDNTIDFQTGWGTNLTVLSGTEMQGFPPFDPPFNEGFIFGAGGGPSLTFARPTWQTVSQPGSTRLVPDISLLADPYTGVEIIETIDGVSSVSVIGGTSLAAPMFSGLMAIAAQKAGHGLGQAAPLVYNLPAGAIIDVTAVSSPTNVSGSVTDKNGTTSYSADQLAAPLGGATTGYLSAFYNSPFSTRWFVITFGTDTGLFVGPGWDSITGVGTPNGAAFVNAISQ